MVNSDQQIAVSQAQEISLSQLVQKIRSWKKLILSKWKRILLCAVIGCVIGLAYSFYKKPVYKAELSFALQDEKSGGNLGGALGLASQFGVDLGSLGSAGGEFSGDNLMALMQSRFVVQKALLSPVMIKGKSTTLAQYYIDFNKLKEKWKGNPELEKITYPVGADASKFTLTQDSLLGVFHKTLIKENLNVDKVDKKLTIISVVVKTTDELFSKNFAEVLVKVVSDFYIKTKTEKAEKNVAVLQRQTDSVRAMLNAAISGVALSNDAAPNANPFLQSLRVPSQKRQVDVQANTAILSELVKNLEISKMSLLQETPLIHIIDTPILPLEKDKVGRLKGAVVGAIIGILLSIIIITVNTFIQKLLA
ncbi:lipopolysaccharide biosynthesis protein [Mucilaginibacter ximonensis]|uniref:Lipopolysaccharide biosynthesis protein n=1 Tax=Mucilaginibacter ximonensis TaxID=538021 RepID=A0ABW5YFY8_9SPHI